MLVFHAQLDAIPVALGVWCAVRSELVARPIAMEAGGHNVRAVATTVLLGNQMLPSGLETASLGQGETVGRGEACAVCQPHREIAVVAPARLAVEGSITGGEIGSGHGRVLMSEGNSRRLDTGRAGTWSLLAMQAQHRWL
jgi:hypothetical protein